MDDCHICGRPAVSEAFVEGARVAVCERCAHYGKEVAKPPSLKGRVPAGLSREAPVKELFPVEGYGKKVRSAREALGLSPEQLASKIFITKNELIHLEEEKIRPAEKTARKLEKELNVVLLEEKAGEEGQKAERKSAGRALTLADIVQIKPKK